MKIILAQGNPEPKYSSTRHNTGFTVLNTLADRIDAKWTVQTKFNAIIAETTISGEKALLVKPTTYYNETGISARKLVDYYKVSPTDDLLVIYDDLALPFGTVRVRRQGSAGGNNGIKSINTHIGPEYTRVRIGTYDELRDHMSDTNFVLSKFNADESDQLDETITPRAIELIQQFCAGTIKPASYK
jgi:PTH1 family peptidyl-tRNA hydrolase